MKPEYISNNGSSKNDLQQDLRYLQLLSRSFPTIAAASTEIITLEAILTLPKVLSIFWPTYMGNTRHSSMFCAIHRVQ